MKTKKPDSATGRDSFRAMYKSFYNLKTKPFQISTDPRFLWLGEKHREALATLKYGVLDNKGFLLITGDVGTGKTTLINALVNSFGSKVIYAAIPDPGLENLDFFKYIAHVFKFEKDFENKGDFLIHFGRFLVNAYRNGKTVVLIIDEAQLLSQEMLEQIRLLSNIEKQQRKLINIFFVGQNEFNDTLLKHENRALRQRITINYNLEPLTLSETGEYIKHRLNKAGSVRMIYNAGALKKIYSFSRGYPRLINIICDHAMLTGYVKEARTIDAKIIKECVKELDISPGDKSKKYKKAKNRPAVPVQSPPPKRLPLLGRGLIYALVLVVSALAVLQVLKIGSHTEYLKTELKKIEKLITARDRPAANVPVNGSKTGPIKINGDQPAREKALAPSLLPVEAAEKRSAAADSPEGGSSDQITRRPPEKAAADGIPLRVLQADEGAAKSKGAETEMRPRKAPDAPPVKAGPDPLVEAKAFVARTGGRLTIHFSYNSNEISKHEFARLKKFAEVAARTPDMRIIVTGHTDTSGSATYNQKLSTFRANIVKSYFVGKGVAPENIIAIGKGPGAPLVKSAPGIRSLSNRRVEIEMKLARLP